MNPLSLEQLPHSCDLAIRVTTTRNTDGIGDCMKDGSPIIPMSLVSPSSSLVSDSRADVENFLEEITLDCPTIGDLCLKYRDLVGCAATLFIPQTDDLVVQVLDASFNGANQELFGWVQQSQKR